MKKLGTYGRKTNAESPNGMPFTLTHDYYYSHVTARLYHLGGNVTFRDHQGNDATVDRVRSPLAWAKRHGYSDTDAVRYAQVNGRN